MDVKQLKIPVDLHTDLKIFATKKQTTITRIVVEALKEYMQNRKGSNEKLAS